MPIVLRAGKVTGGVTDTIHESFQVTGLQTHVVQRKRHWKGQVITESELEFREGTVDFSWPRQADLPRRRVI